MAPRKIIHIDMDAFFASVEQRDFPHLQGKPVVVGGLGPRAVVAAASYEARQFGIHSAMPMGRAKNLCDQLIIQPGRMQTYKNESHHIHAIFQRYTNLIEPLSLDEAYLDVTENFLNLNSATQIAQQIKTAIWEETHLTASAGISVNKMLAKIASAMNKPNGLTLIRPEQAAQFIDTLPVKRFHGIGQRTAERMLQLGIETGAHLRQWDRITLIKWFGKAGGFYHELAHNIDNRPVNPNRERKSVGAEHTFDQDIFAKPLMQQALNTILAELWNRLDQLQLRGSTLTLKIKFADFQQITRAHTAQQIISTQAEAARIITALLQREPLYDRGVRLLGISMGHLCSSQTATTQPQQLSLF
ncbi:DNA-directed DNA polymerase [Magnetococcus marinus MC-1]|uniref:DNA polymerase IV n=1 Tax=Magnetococcus marinus (strain ATCC BAA-1437 / JCM 17883 / MC-1) TaxID=156889 RepID=A0LDH9_MAGMM|nr:DNA polymerase IV [Magnetococcus marinus]ABK46022.1 DNA-directed DNA polymerase [Magnetococcus marinus MC-1]